ncbi:MULTISPECIES: LmbU family transcriptional regulator [Micromonospora]|uniref:LmbU family transcriptional regulator n=1 Tax=Micromonospora TaxID=1873 RepID=UPI0027DE1D34|nr:LmbU family transcriptional regulator [Micromonospora antibiotica]
MSSQFPPLPADAVTAGVAVLPPPGLRLDSGIPFDNWLGIGQRLAEAASNSAWCLGDWLIYGETRFTGRYRSAVEQTSLDYKTLRNYAWVARKFAHPRRRAGLSFEHHAAVAGLPEPEQDYWLRKAEVFSWSRNDLRREVRASLSTRGEDLADRGVAAGVTTHAHAGREDAGIGDTAMASKLHLDVTDDQLAMITEAASKSQLSVGTWAQQMLEQAARAALAFASREPNPATRAVGVS